MLNNVRYTLGIDDHKQYIDDDERYLKMMMKLDPNDSDVLERNRNNIALVCFECFKIKLPDCFQLQLKHPGTSFEKRLGTFSNPILVMDTTCYIGKEQILWKIQLTLTMGTLNIIKNQWKILHPHWKENECLIK